MTRAAGAKAIAMLDNLALTANGRYGVGISAAQLAEQHGLLAERASDQLDYFDFFGLELDGVLFGFRTYFRSPAMTPHAYVTVAPSDTPNAVEMIARLVGVTRADVEIFDADC